MKYIFVPCMSSVVFLSVLEKTHNWTGNFIHSCEVKIRMTCCVHHVYSCMCDLISLYKLSVFFWWGGGGGVDMEDFH
jgi:hypothetical protein